ncbi:MAG: SEC-C metal-binding domain-containing protein, partial [Alphaproteobacteria bacterium]
SYPEDWDIKGLGVNVKKIFNLDLPMSKWVEEEGVEEEVFIERITKAVDEKMAAKITDYGQDIWGQVEKNLLLKTLDEDWKDHLNSLEHLRKVVSLRAYGQRNPLDEYKTDGFEMFGDLLYRVRENVSQILAHIEISIDRGPLSLKPKSEEMRTLHADPEARKQQAIAARKEGPAPAPKPLGTVTSRARSGAFDPNDSSTWGRINRNALCPCGSGKKYKHCHGKFK